MDPHTQPGLPPTRSTIAHARCLAQVVSPQWKLPFQEEEAAQVGMQLTCILWWEEMLNRPLSKGRPAIGEVLQILGIMIKIVDAYRFDVPCVIINLVVGDV